MQSSSRVRAWACAVAALRETDTAFLAVQTSRRLYFSTSTGASPASPDKQDPMGGDGAASPSPSSSSSSAPQRYRRRSSDPQTLREKADFRRDYKFAKHRPLPDAPWRQLKTKTYLDDAERLYGRKETWAAVDDAVLREKLVAILQDYLSDTLAAARLEAREARKYHHLCSMAAKQYRAHVTSGAFGMADEMQAWAQDVLRGHLAASSADAAVGEASVNVAAVDSSSATAGPSSAALNDGEGPTLSSSSAAAGSDDSAAMELREARRRRGERAVLAHTAAMADLPDADARHTPQSAFPFLRRRAVEDEATLDPSLVDWTAKYFPEDDARTFAEPPRLRTHARSDDGGAATAPAGDDGDGDVTQSAAQAGSGPGFGDVQGADAFVSPSSPAAPRRLRSMHARHRLQRTLRDHENRHRATFDAEGIYYKVRRQSEADERAPKPQAVKASELEPAGRRSEVVKVPWSVAAKAKAQGYSSETLRAKERLIRLTRGEDPETIP
ncbi:hypothetical protein N2W54_007841 [Lotmaria passim]